MNVPEALKKPANILYRHLKSTWNVVKRKVSQVLSDDTPKYIQAYDGKVLDVYVSDPASEDRKTLLDYARDDILNAKREIDITSFAIGEGLEREKLVRLLAEAQRRNPNLKINIIANFYSDAVALNNLLVKEGVKANLKAFNLTLATNLQASEHSKYIIIDQEKAYVTDQNIQDKPMTEIGKGYNWYGLTVKLEGDVVKGLMEVFKHSWNTSEAVNLVNEREELEVKPQTGRYFKRAKDVVKAWRSGELDGKIILAYSEPWKNTLIRRIFLRSPDDLRDLDVKLIRGAQREIRIITPNLSHLRVIWAIADALKRGVKVKILLSKDFNEEINLYLHPENVGDNIKSLITLKLLAGDKIKNLEVRWYSNDGKKPEEGNLARTSHAKYLSVDGEVASFGSLNQDTVSFKISRETNVVIFGREEVSRLEDKFFKQVWDRSIPQPVEELPSPGSYFAKAYLKTIKSLLRRLKYSKG